MKTRWKVLLYETQDGKCPVKRYLNSISLRNKAKVLSLIEYLEEMGPELPRPYADLLSDGIHELRVRLSGNQVRILYFFCCRDYIVLTHSFIKREDTVPKKEIEKAIISREDFLRRAIPEDSDNLRGIS